MVIRVSDKKKNYSKVTKLLVKPFSIQIQNLDIAFHTLWSGLDDEQYIGVIGQIDRRI